MWRKTLVLAAIGTIALAGSALARDQIRIVGSSTVFPFSAAVAEAFGKSAKFRTPVVESSGTGGGFKAFCAGIGESHPDITNASRRIAKSEFDDCARNGVQMSEVKIGYDGIVIANAKSAKQMTVTRQQIYLALAKTVPVDGKLVANPYKKWSDVDKALPDRKIEVLGPPPTSGTRDAFVEMILDVGAKKFPILADLAKADVKAYAAAAHTIREDGAYVDAGENDNVIVNKLLANPGAFGVFGYSFLDQNADRLQGAALEGVPPTFENIADGKYTASRPLFFYVKKQHVGVVPGLAEFVGEFTSDKAWGKRGYLADKGLVPLPDNERKSIADRAKSLIALVLQ